MALLSEHVHVRFLRYSAFYTPLLLTLNSKLLARAGIRVTYDKAGPQQTVEQGFADGSVQVAQSAPAVSFLGALAKEPPAYRHFAVMNTRDGFFLGARTTNGSDAGAATAGEPQWAWQQLTGRSVLVDHFFQPLALFRTALRCQGVDEGAVRLLDVGGPDDIESAFRAGRGDLMHLQGPGPQQLEEEVRSEWLSWGRMCLSVGGRLAVVPFVSCAGMLSAREMRSCLVPCCCCCCSFCHHTQGLCKVVASVGVSAVPLAFSSLCATPEWLASSPTAPIFMSAFSKARAHAAVAPPSELAAEVAPFLPEFSSGALTKAICAYQDMGTWAGGSEEISPELYQQTVQVFRDVGYINAEPPMDLVVAPPPPPVK